MKKLLVVIGGICLAGGGIFGQNGSSEEDLKQALGPLSGMIAEGTKVTVTRITPAGGTEISEFVSGGGKADKEEEVSDAPLFKMIKQDPKAAVSYNQTARTALSDRNWNKAIVYSTQAITFNEEYADAYNTRAVAYASKGDHGDAVADYSMAIKYNDKDKTYYQSRGYSYFCLGEYDKAIEDFSKAISIDPQYTKAYLWRLESVKKRHEMDEFRLKNDTEMLKKMGLLLE